MRSLEVVFRRRDLTAGQAAGKACAVIDVLRAGTSVAHALAAGAMEIRLFGDVEELQSAEQAFHGKTVLAGERGGKRPKGFDLGNSPSEYTAKRVGGRTVFFTTTNGTAALLGCRDAAFVVLAALVNADAAVKALAARQESLLLVCAGTEGRYAVEDTLCAGLMVSRLMSEVGPTRLTLDDGARIALCYAADASRTQEVVEGGAHGKLLTSLGFEKDVKTCSELDSLGVVAVLKREPLGLVARKE